MAWKIEHAEASIREKESVIETELVEDDDELNNMLLRFDDEIQAQHTKIQRLRNDREKIAGTVDRVRARQNELQQTRGQANAEMEQLVSFTKYCE